MGAQGWWEQSSEILKGVYTHILEIEKNDDLGGGRETNLNVP
jgi:hypothetical protein